MTRQPNPFQATMQGGVACRCPVKCIRKVRDGTCAKPAVRRAATPAGAAAKKFIRMSVTLCVSIKAFRRCY